MLVSAVLDPSVFDAGDFDDLYAIHAEDFLQGIWRNGVLIVDSERKLQEALFKKAESLPIKGNRLRTLLTDLLKEKSKRVAVPSVSPSNVSSRDLLDLTCHLKKDTEPDGLLVGDKNFEKLRFDPEHRHGIVPLSEYRDSNFEKERQRYCDGFGPIDMLSRSEVDEIVIRSVRFSKWLRFYDAYVGTGDNTSHFRKGIEYILSLWREHGFFASQQGVGSVEIFTCSAEQIRDDETDSAKESKEERNQESYQKVVRELIEPLNSNEDFPWSIESQRKISPLGREARRMGLSAHGDPVPEIKVTELPSNEFRSLMHQLGNWQLFVARNHLVNLMERKEFVEIVDRLRAEFHEFFVCYLEMELFLENYDYDPDDGLELRPEFIESLKREEEYIKSGGKMFTLEEVAKE